LHDPVAAAFEKRRLTEIALRNERPNLSPIREVTPTKEALRMPPAMPTTSVLPPEARQAPPPQAATFTQQDARINAVRESLLENVSEQKEAEKLAANIERLNKR
jgi:hypothetical protein